MKTLLLTLTNSTEIEIAVIKLVCVAFILLMAVTSVYIGI